MSLLEVRGLAVEYAGARGPGRAVDGVDLRLDEGETLGLVGESGSGKSSVALACMGLLEPPAARATATRIALEGRDLAGLAPRERRRACAGRMAMVFQDPQSSLNPFLTVGLQLSEVLEVHRGLARRAARREAARALGRVGIPSPEERLDSFPHELSGGMRQRVMIAMALLLDPRVLLADEPTTALDVTLQAQVLDLLRALQRERGTAVLLVTHSLGVVAGMADRVAVMYAGRVVERASAAELFARPLHPYSAGLLACVPRLDGPERRRLDSIPGQPPAAGSIPAGCAFEPRCGLAQPRCRADRPALEVAGDEDGTRRETACFEWRALAAREAGADAHADARTQNARGGPA